MTSSSRSWRERPATNRSAVSTASRRWRRRISSSGRIDLDGRVPHGVSEMSAEIVIGAKIHIAADLFGELEFHGGNVEKPRDSVLVELDEKIDVAVFTE